MSVCVGGHDLGTAPATKVRVTDAGVSRGGGKKLGMCAKALSAMPVKQ